MFTVSEQCTEAWTDLSDNSANVDLGCQAYNGHPDALLLGDLDGILDVAWITGGQASKEHQDLYSSMFTWAAQYNTFQEIDAKRRIIFCSFLFYQHVPVYPLLQAVLPEKYADG